MTDDQAWPIARIEQALGTDELRAQFAEECASTPVHKISEVYAKWRAIAEEREASLKRHT